MKRRIGMQSLLLFVALLFTGCKTNTIYVPVETVRVEYRDKLMRDSVRLYDSIFVKMRGDTVWLEKYRYLYRDRLVRDSVFRTDSIAVPYPVEVPGPEVNRLTSFQSFQIWCGRILLLLIIGYFALKKFRK
jgi:hypothetical protein